MFEIGEKVVILKSNHTDLIGRVATVIGYDCINMVKVSFDNEWCGYYKESELEKYVEKKNQTLYVNLFGAPGAGKSTGATYIFSHLKLNGIDSEYISEFAKDKCWEDNKFIFGCPENQLYIGAKQFYRINQVSGKVRVAVTDSPVFLNAFYNKSEFLGKEYNTVMLRLFNKFDNLNFYIERVKPYHSNGRNQNEEESNRIGKDIREYLETNNIPFIAISGNENGYDKAIDIIYNRMGLNA